MGFGNPLRKLPPGGIVAGRSRHAEVRSQSPLTSPKIYCAECGGLARRGNPTKTVDEPRARCTTTYRPTTTDRDHTTNRRGYDDDDDDDETDGGRTSSKADKAATDDCNSAT